MQNIEFTQETFEQLKKDISNSGLIVCGEVHGIVENYTVYKYLFDNLAVGQIGVELPDATFHFLLELITSEEKVSRLKKLKWPDGRINTSFIDLLSYLDCK